MKSKSVDVTMPLGIDGARLVAVVRCGAQANSCRSRMGLAWALPSRTSPADAPSVAPRLQDFVLTNDLGVSPAGRADRGQLSRREQLARAVGTKQELFVRGSDLAREDFDALTFTTKIGRA
jgi:hypothetical protein